MNLSEFPLTGQLDLVETPFVNETSETVLRCRRIQIKPDPRQREILKSWFDWYRYAYNEAVKQIRDQRFIGEPTKANFRLLRSKIKSELTPHQKQLIKESKIPTHTFDNAINDVCKAYKTAFTLLRNGNIRYFHMRYKKSDSPKETITLESSCFSKRYNSFAVRSLGTMIKSSSNIKGVSRDSRLQYNKNTGEMILYAPLDVCLKECEDREPWGSLDPGIRTFQTVYSPAFIADIGTIEPVKIKRLINDVESLKKHQSRKWYKKFSRRKYDKMQHIRDDLHWKTALKLVQSYDTILIGSMSTKGIVSRSGNLRRGVKTVANMLSHYLFRERLSAKAEEYGAEVIVVNEAYTSKTCGGCFHINSQLGANKKFRCPREECNFTADRDFNGARNIALKHFGLFNPIR